MEGDRIIAALKSGSDWKALEKSVKVSYRLGPECVLLKCYIAGLFTASSTCPLNTSASSF